MPLLRRVIGAVLRRVRQHQGRTLRDVAETAGVSLPYLSEVERGTKEASSEVLAAICRALGLPLPELLDEVRRELLRQTPAPRVRAQLPHTQARVPHAELPHADAPLRQAGAEMSHRRADIRPVRASQFRTHRSPVNGTGPQARCALGAALTRGRRRSAEGRPRPAHATGRPRPAHAAGRPRAAHALGLGCRAGLAVHAGVA